MMKLFLVLVLIGAAATAVVPVEDKYANRARNYHKNIGIKEATRIKAAEEATDFSGARIVGGSNAALGQFPHMGGLVIAIDLLIIRATSVCGSSMITSTRAVTAAHCWFDGILRASELTVVYGSLTLFSGGTRLNTRDVVMHPDWNPETMENDVAVISHSHVRYTLHIHPIALASSNDLYVNARAQAAGYGSQADVGIITQDQQLHHVYLQVISNEECAETFSFLPASNICTSGYGGRSVCGGDSGGPLTVDRRLVGIVSFGYAVECEQGYPEAYARVTSYSSWIAAQF